MIAITDLNSVSVGSSIRRETIIAINDELLALRKRFDEQIDDTDFSFEYPNILGALYATTGRLIADRAKNEGVHCDNACAWVEPYGWVPEAGCPIHDQEST